MSSTDEFTAGSTPTRRSAQLTAVVEAVSPTSTTDATPPPPTLLLERTDSAFDGDRGITDTVRMFGIAVTQAGSFR